MFVQIYGITTVEDAVEVDRLGPDTIGVVLDEGVATWDSVDEDTARRIVAAVTGARVVALSLSTDPDRILATADLLGPDVVHLARAASMPRDTLGRIRAALAPAELMLTVPVDGPEAVALAGRMAGHADYLLVDTKDAGTGVVGATGMTHDWAISAAIVREVTAPVVLAGGLGPENVSEAIATVMPFGVDSETRTSRDGDRRRKDLAKVEVFIARARSG